MSLKGVDCVHVVSAELATHAPGVHPYCLTGSAKAPNG